jgi:outer membrane lipoprotein carrier protein
MNRTLQVILFSALTAIVSAQSDQESVKILDRFSSVASSAPSVLLKFSMVTINQAENKNDTVAGSLIMSKDKYRLEMPDNITWLNGSVSWNYLVKEKEVTDTKPDTKDNFVLSKPSSIFTLYKKGYKTRVVEENARSYIVDLYPEDLQSDMVRIRLSIWKTNADLIVAEYKRKDGITVYLLVKEYNLNTKPEPSDFTFIAKNYKGVEVIDMR